MSWNVAGARGEIPWAVQRAQGLKSAFVRLLPQRRLRIVFETQSHRMRLHPAEARPILPPQNEPSFSGQAAIPPQAVSSQTSDRRMANDSSEDVRSVAGRYSRLMDSGRDNSTDSHPARSAQTETLTWQQAVDRLNEHGIRTFRLTPDSSQNGYRFVCLVTSIDDPRISRRFEAESIDPLVAGSRRARAGRELEPASMTALATCLRRPVLCNVVSSDTISQVNCPSKPDTSSVLLRRTKRLAGGGRSRFARQIKNLVVLQATGRVTIQRVEVVSSLDWKPFC